MEQASSTKILNTLICDERISLECRLLIINIVAQGKEWEINVKEICEHTENNCGRTKIYSLINEAIEFGYIHKIILKRGNLNRNVYSLDKKIWNV